MPSVDTSFRVTLYSRLNHTTECGEDLQGVGLSIQKCEEVSSGLEVNAVMEINTTSSHSISIM